MLKKRIDNNEKVEQEIEEPPPNKLYVSGMPLLLRGWNGSYSLIQAKYDGNGVSDGKHQTEIGTVKNFWILDASTYLCFPLYSTIISMNKQGVWEFGRMLPFAPVIMDKLFVGKKTKFPIGDFVAPNQLLQITISKEKTHKIDMVKLFIPFCIVIIPIIIKKFFF